MSSMLAQRVAINKLADSFMAFNTNYQDAGLFGVYAVCSDPSTIDDLVRRMPWQGLTYRQVGVIYFF